MAKTERFLNKKKEKNITVAVSGYFNPLHVGHLEMINKAKKLGDKLVVIVNNDYQVALKGAVPFMPEKDRMIIIKFLRSVDEVFLAIDKDKTVLGNNISGTFTIDFGNSKAAMVHLIKTE